MLENHEGAGPLRLVVWAQGPGGFQQVVHHDVPALASRGAVQISVDRLKPGQEHRYAFYTLDEHGRPLARSREDRDVLRQVVTHAVGTLHRDDGVQPDDRGRRESQQVDPEVRPDAGDRRQDDVVDLAAVGVGDGLGAGQVGIAALVDDVVDLVPTETDLGSDVVWSAVGEFKDRWERGMNNLVGDVQELSGRLGKVVMNYAELDQNGTTTFDGVAAELRGLRVMNP